MTVCNKTKRPWLQIHLSTAVILMFVAGGLLWTNCRRSCKDVSGSAYTFDGPILSYHIEYGWPAVVRRHSIMLYPDPFYSSPADLSLTFEIHRGTSNPPPVAPPTAEREGEWNEELGWRLPAGYLAHRFPASWSIPGLLKNGLVALAVLAAVAFLCEWPIRKRGGKPRSAP
ncbi:MAG: hypothetical protein NTW87_13565 [Planctomycetota bacterium]|nr:hypothetical protein [Planctomycetota bacterium]